MDTMVLFSTGWHGFWLLVRRNLFFARTLSPRLQRPVCGTLKRSDYLYGFREENAAMEYKHLKPINAKTVRKRNRPMKHSPSLSCDYPEFAYPATPEPARLASEQKVAAKERKTAAA